jgi:hypothetical protein
MIRVNTGLTDIVAIRTVWRVAYWLVIAGTAVGLYKAYTVGRDMRAIAQKQFEQAVANEDHAFCESFGMRAGTSDYAACCRELSIIRQKQTERDRQAAPSLL